MPYKIETVTGHYEVLEAIRRFAGGFGLAAAPGYSGTGDGTITGVDTHPATISETWTITCTVAAADGGTFSVVGSVSGAQADAAVGVAYSNAFIDFLINDGAADFVVNDVFTIAVTQGELSAISRAWEVLRWDTSALDGESLAIHELILKGSGLSGTDEIFIGLRTYQSVNNDYYNLEIAGFSGYVPGNSFSTQPGYSGSRAVPLWNQAIPYWLLVNGNRIAFAAKVETVYEHFYLGKFLPYATPSQFPYPVVVGGMLNGVPATRYSDTSHSWPYSGSSNVFVMRFVDGLWRQPDCWPFNSDDPTTGQVITIRDTGGDYGIMPIVLNDADPNVFGELDGIFHITGFNNAVENTLTIGGVPYVVMRDVWRTGFNDYIAMRLD